MDNENKEFDKKTVEEIKRKARYTDEGNEALADYTYDEMFKEDEEYINKYGD